VPDGETYHTHPPPHETNPPSQLLKTMVFATADRALGWAIDDPNSNGTTLMIALRY
jgi:hypothetical protein